MFDNDLFNGKFIYKWNPDEAYKSNVICTLSVEFKTIKFSHECKINRNAIKQHDEFDIF